MGDLKRQLDKELGAVISKHEKQMRAVMLNAVGKAKEINRDRWDTGFMINNWFFSRNGNHPDIKNPYPAPFPQKAGLTARNLESWKLGENAFIVNNTEYASYHDLGTIGVYPLFISFQVGIFLEKGFKAIK